MRVLLVAAVLAAAGAVGLLLLKPPSETAPRPERVDLPGAAAPETGPPPLPDVEAMARARPRHAETQDELARFVALCVQRGAAAVPDLVERLRHRPDVALGLLWRFSEGRPDGYPTLRAAYLDALISIPGRESTAALREILDLTASVEETYMIAHALHERGRRAWLGTALDRAVAGHSPVRRDVCRKLVLLAAEADPVAAAAGIVSRAPRGEDPADPNVLAVGLRALPLDNAVSAARQLLLDRQVTVRAKGRYVENLANRGEPAIFERLKQMMDESDWSPDLRLQIAFAAARSEGFYKDEVDYSVAKATGQGDPRAIKDRFDKRLTAVTLLVETALGELAGTDDPRAAALRRALARHHERVK